MDATTKKRRKPAESSMTALLKRQLRTVGVARFSELLSATNPLALRFALYLQLTEKSIVAFEKMLPKALSADADLKTITDLLAVFEEEFTSK